MRLFKRPATDITINQGSDMRLGFSFEDESGAEIDLTGYRARMQLRHCRLSKTVLDELTTENGRLINDGRVITACWSAQTTGKLQFIKAVYDLELYQGDNVSRVISGAVYVSREVTK